MSWMPCPVCNGARKTEIIWTKDGWVEPPCYRCGDPGFLKPFEDDEIEEKADD